MERKMLTLLLLGVGLALTGCGEKATSTIMAPRKSEPPAHDTPLSPELLIPTPWPFSTNTPEATLPLPTVILPTAVAEEVPLPVFENPRRGPDRSSPTEIVTEIPRGTLLVKTETAGVIAILPDGRRLPSDDATFSRYRRPGSLSADDRYWVKIVTEQTGSNIRSEIRVVWRDTTTEGVAGYASGGRRRFLDDVLAVSRVLPDAAYVVAVTQDVADGPLELVIAEVPYRSHHQGKIASLPAWIKEVVAINFIGEEVVFLGVMDGKKHLFRLSEPIYHRLPKDQETNCPPPRHVLSDCLRKFNEERSPYRIPLLIADLPDALVEFAIVE